MVMNTLKCSHLMSLHIKGLITVRPSTVDSRNNIFKVYFMKFTEKITKPT